MNHLMPVALAQRASGALAAALALAVAVALTPVTFAADEGASEDAERQASELDRVRGFVMTQTGGREPTSLAKSPVDGLYEVAYGAEVFYISGDGRYVLRGDMIDLQLRVNLSDDVRRGTRRDFLRGLDESRMVVFAGDPAKGDGDRPVKVSRTVTVFTDVDCPYCAKLHEEMRDYNARGITVRYLAFPRAGIPSRSYEKMVSVWCADDQLGAMTLTKAGGEPTPARCENPVADHYQAGRTLGINGTPTILLSDGTMLPGYVPPEQLEQIIADGGNG